MKQYLLDYFAYNDWANKKILQAILLLPEKDGALYLFSHLIYAQDKWFNRVTKQQNDNDLAWYGAAFDEQEIEDRWNKSYVQWSLLLNNPDTETDEYVVFNRKADGALMRVKLKDIIFQLNCHAVHHRAQINKLISSQGVAVPATDYIFTAISEVK